MKFETGNEGKLFSLPHPDAVKAIGRQLWNDAIDLAIVAVKAGKSVAEAIESAIGHLRKNVSGFDDAKTRQNLSYIIGQETRETKTFPVEGQSVEMRKSAERATTSPMVPEAVQERIQTAPESFYKQQSMKRVEQAVGDMTDLELAGVPRDSNLYTAAKLEQANRLFKAGQDEAGYQVFLELEKEGTRLGQLINQFKLLKGSRPESVVKIINQTLRKAGRDVLTKEQEGKAIEIAKESKVKDTELNKATDEWVKDPSSENAAKAEQALIEANESALKLQRFIQRFQPRSTPALIKSILQGNLLTPISEVANLFGNVSFLPFRAGTRIIGAGLDIVDAFVRKKPREISVGPVSGTVEAAKGAARGLARLPSIARHGTGDVIKGETRAGLHPLRAWALQFAKKPEAPTKGGRLTLQDRINLAIEGTLGVPAEVMLRGLGIGDQPFREAAKARATAEQLRLSNVPRDQWRMAQKFPELFLDQAALDRIGKQTVEAIFQRDSETLKHITRWIHSKGDLFDLGVASVAPYKLTPWNLIGEILSYNPLVAMGRTALEARRGNSRAAKLNAGKVVVGSLLTATGWWLYKNGLMSPSLDQPDETMKGRILSEEVMPPNHINLSGLKRALAGGNPAFQTGDETVNVFRAGGLAGAMFYMTANIGRDFERRPEAADTDLYMSILSQSTLEQARFGLNQSFLSGIEGLLTAVKDGNADSYIQSYANTVSSVPLPNTLGTITRATRDYKADTRDPSLPKRVENVVKNRLGVAGLDEYLPLRRDLWGRPVRETPENRNAFIYHFFDITKGKQVTSDPVELELYRLWRKTGSNEVIPSIPSRSVTFGRVNYELDQKQYEHYIELIGGRRREIVDSMVVNPEFHKLNDEQKIEILKRAWDYGQRYGKGEFLSENPELIAKPGRAGFNP